MGRAISVAVGFAARVARVQPPCPALAYAGAWAGRLDCRRAGWVAGACLPAACRWPLCTAASHPAATSVPHHPPDPPPRPAAGRRPHAAARRRPATRPDRAGHLQGMEGAATLPRDHAVALWLGSVPGDEEAGRAQLQRALGKRAGQGRWQGRAGGRAQGGARLRPAGPARFPARPAGAAAGWPAQRVSRPGIPSQTQTAPPGHPPAPGRGRRKGLVDRQQVGGRLWASAGRLDGTAAMHGSHPQKRYPPPPPQQPASVCAFRRGRFKSRRCRCGLHSRGA